MIKKNDEFIGEVSDFGSNGEGIIKRDNLVIFIPFSIAGETVKYRILKVESSAAYAKVIEIIKPSPFRIFPECPVFGKCGGCHLQHIDYAKTLDVKRENIKRCFAKIANIKIEPEQTVVSDKKYGYRNKLQLPVQSVNGETVIGFYAQNSHRIVPINDCPINPPWTKNIITVFKEYFSANNVSAYDPVSKSGDVKEITVKESGKGLIITVVSTKNTLKNVESLINGLKNSFSEFSLYLNVNAKDTNVIYGEKFILLYGKAEYTSELNGVVFNVGVRSFSQVNDGVCEKLYKTAVSLATASSPEIIIDAYSGAGLMTAMLAKNCKKTYGIEIVKEAVNLADKVAKINGLSDKIININGKTEEELPKIISDNKGKEKITVVLDPPRKGCDIAVLDAIIRSGAERIVYISCMPSTLARDIGILTGTLVSGEKRLIRAENFEPRYKIETVIPFDMFPQTKHVETLVLLSRV